MRRRRVVDPRTGRLYSVVRPARLGAPPAAVRRARLDNLALVPASLLPYKDEYRALANRQPPGTTLVVLPPGDSSRHRTIQRVASRLRATNRRVHILRSEAVVALHRSGAAHTN